MLTTEVTPKAINTSVHLLMSGICGSIVLLTIADRTPDQIGKQ